MELFTIILRKGANIYHGTNKTSLKIINKPTWFGENITDSVLYGNNIFEFKLSKDLRLIDINSPIFQSHYVNMINNKFVRKEERMKYLCALGLPNFQKQIEYIGEPSCKANLEILNTVADYLNFYQNKNRLSLHNRNINTDNDFVKMLIEFYPEYDGYISRQSLPSLYLCGFLSPELCLFNINSVKYIKNFTYNLRGGKTKLDPIEDPQYRRTYKDVKIKNPKF